MADQQKTAMLIGGVVVTGAGLCLFLVGRSTGMSAERELVHGLTSFGLVGAGSALVFASRRSAPKEAKVTRRGKLRPKAELAAEEEAADSERRLARYAAMGIPSATIVGALAVGIVMSAGPAILVLVGGTLLGTISLLWASLRTLSGDAPLPLELEAMAIRTRRVDELSEKKTRVLRALKDLEHEHAVGKIDDKDYGTLGARFRDEAKVILREMDAEVDPMREKAEELAKEYLAKRGVEEKADAADETPEKTRDRVACSKCATSNEPDAAFCKKCGTSLSPEDADASR